MALQPHPSPKTVASVYIVAIIAVFYSYFLIALHRDIMLVSSLVLLIEASLLCLGIRDRWRKLPNQRPDEYWAQYVGQRAREIRRTGENLSRHSFVPYVTLYYALVLELHTVCIAVLVYCWRDAAYRGSMLSFLWPLSIVVLGYYAYQAVNNIRHIERVAASNMQRVSLLERIFFTTMNGIVLIGFVWIFAIRFHVLH